MSELRCVLITDDFLPHIGGSRIYYDNVARILAGDLAVVTRARPDTQSFDSTLPYAIRRTPLSTHRASTGGVFRELSDILALRRAAAAAFPSAPSYLAGEVNPSAFAAALLSRTRRAPYGVIVHDEPLAGAGRLERSLRRKALGAARAIIVSASFAAARVRELTGGKVPVFHAPPGVDFDTFAPGRADETALKRMGIRQTGYLLCVGRLVSYKNVRAVIRTVAELAPGGPGLVVVGEGAEREPLEACARQCRVSDRVVFAGRVGAADLARIYRGALVYVFPSLPARGLQHEGIGMAAMEAAACGCPVIASTATSAVDFVEDGRTGIAFDPLKAGSLTDGVRRLVADEGLRRSLSCAALERVTSTYSWQRTAETVRAAIDAMLG